jgi:hypothetical protein
MQHKESRYSQSSQPLPPHLSSFSELETASFSNIHEKVRDLITLFIVWIAIFHKLFLEWCWGLNSGL